MDADAIARVQQLADMKAAGVLTEEELDRYLVITDRVGSAPLHLITPIERDACERVRAHNGRISNLSQAEGDNAVAQGRDRRAAAARRLARQK